MGTRWGRRSIDEVFYFCQPDLTNGFLHDLFFFVVVASRKTPLLTFFLLHASHWFETIKRYLVNWGKWGGCKCREIHQAYCATEGARCGLIAADLVGLLHRWGETLHCKHVKRRSPCDPYIWWPWTWKHFIVCHLSNEPDMPHKMFP